MYKYGIYRSVSMGSPDLVERRGFKRAIITLTAKNARLIWALLHSEKEYQAMTMRNDFLK